MNAQSAFTLINPASGDLAFKLSEFEEASRFDHVQRHNYYSMIILLSGTIKLKADFSDYEVGSNSLICFTPFQPFMFQTTGDVKGIVINFHPDFFCIHKHHKEVACHGVLFNAIYDPPFFQLDENAIKAFKDNVEEMKAEMLNQGLAQYEILVSYLKIFLIRASRIKTEQIPQKLKTTNDSKEPFILQGLKDAIETHYKTMHSASDYANLLNISTSALAKLSKAHFNKTLTDLIAERIVIEAKRELYLSSKAVKQIAFELGFNDEYYFSRFFKNNADVSPQLYRETVGFARAEA